MPGMTISPRPNIEKGLAFVLGSTPRGKSNFMGASNDLATETCKQSISEAAHILCLANLMPAYEIQFSDKVKGGLLAIVRTMTGVQKTQKMS